MSLTHDVIRIGAEHLRVRKVELDYHGWPSTRALHELAVALEIGIHDALARRDPGGINVQRGRAAADLEVVRIEWDALAQEMKVRPVSHRAKESALEEYRVAADLCEERGLDDAAALLRSVAAGPSVPKIDPLACAGNEGARRRVPCSGPPTHTYPDGKTPDGRARFCDAHGAGVGDPFRIELDGTPEAAHPAKG
jgi:hypothetical protein